MPIVGRSLRGNNIGGPLACTNLYRRIYNVCPQLEVIYLYLLMYSLVRYFGFVQVVGRARRVPVLVRLRVLLTTLVFFVDPMLHRGLFQDRLPRLFMYVHVFCDARLQGGEHSSVLMV